MIQFNEIFIQLENQGIGHHYFKVNSMREEMREVVANEVAALRDEVLNCDGGGGDDDGDGDESDDAAGDGGGGGGGGY